MQRVSALRGKSSWHCGVGVLVFRDLPCDAHDSILDCLKGYDTLGSSYLLLLLQMAHHSFFPMFNKSYNISQSLLHHFDFQSPCFTMCFTSLGSGSAMRCLFSSSRCSRFNCFACLGVGMRTDHHLSPKILVLIASTQ